MMFTKRAWIEGATKDDMRLLETMLDLDIRPMRTDWNDSMQDILMSPAFEDYHVHSSKAAGVLRRFHDY